ncbi:MAG TPA: hypothetical protein VNZ52_14760 [Candidatus Thermoplasmatota archaeon]|nr:hypothetical protein [Candidatus Thermoplasmatota archaeon]
MALAGCASPTATQTPTPGLGTEAVEGGSGTSGGTVTNVPPVYRAFAGSATAGDNSGSSFEVFSGTLFDANGEKDLRSGLITVTVAIPGGATAAYTHTVTAAEAEQNTDEPANYGTDAFKVWTGTKNDGQIFYKFRYSYATGTPPGTYTFTSAFTPLGGVPVAAPATDSTTIATFKLITVSSAPVKSDGTPSASNNWGLWTAVPGQRNVESQNFVKIVNSGQDATAAIFVDFTETEFRGADANYTIPIRGNIQFSHCEVASATVAPSACTFSAWTDASAQGTTLTFTGLAKAMYVKYRVVAIPDVVAGQSYGASYTITEL